MTLMYEAWRQFSGREGPNKSPIEGQNPQIYLAGLEGRPWWPRERFPWIAEVEARFPEILAEFEVQLQGGGVPVPPAASIPHDQRAGDENLIVGDAGGWRFFRVAYNGVTYTQIDLVPKLWSILTQHVPRLCGTIGYAGMLPGTHIRSHWGNSNAKLRVHMGLVTPPGPRIRVGQEWREWSKGVCQVLDDSFEHEVRHEGESIRYILNFDVWHPDLTDSEVEWLTMAAKALVGTKDDSRVDARWGKR